MALVLFMGRFHVLALHLPIALILIAAIAEAYAWRSRQAHLDAALPLLWGAAAASAVITAALGYLHYLEGGFDGPAASLHMTLGTSLAVAAVLAWLVRRSPARTVGVLRSGSSVVAVVLVLFTAYFGSELTHGSGYLAEHMPFRGRDAGYSASRGGAIDESALAALTSAGFQAREIAAGRSGLRVTFVRAHDPIGDEQIRALVAAAGAVEVLSLADASITDRHAAELAGLSNLVRLDLRYNALTDQAIGHFAALRKLEYLNLVGNSDITDTALEALEALPTIKRVYLWDTGVTAEAAARAGAKRPGLALDVGVATHIDYGEPARIAGTWNLDYLDAAKRQLRGVMTLDQKGDSASGNVGPSSVVARIRGTRVSFYIRSQTVLSLSTDLEGEVAEGRMEGPQWTAVRDQAHVD